MKTDWQHTRHQIQSFVIIGILATLLDFGLYWWWHHYLTFSVAKTLSFLSGSLFVYLANKFFTFKQKKHSSKEIFKFAFLYFSTMLINVMANSGSIWLAKRLFPALWQHFPQLIIIFAFLLATGLSTLLNFSGQKCWVFNKNDR